MNERDRERYVRWQDYRIQHLGYAVNLFLGFGVASIAFAMTRPNEVEGIIPFCWSISLVAGVIAVVSRLVDFRYTCKKIKSGNQDYELTTSLAGHTTWVAFGVQLVTYCAGAGMFLIWR